MVLDTVGALTQHDRAMCFTHGTTSPPYSISIRSAFSTMSRHFWVAPFLAATVNLFLPVAYGFPFSFGDFMGIL